MTAVQTKQRPSVGARRTGYAFAAVVNAVLLYLVNSWPGWDVLPFLTADFEEVLGLVNLSLWAGVVANVLYLVYDGPWFRSLGEAVTTAITFVVAVRMWQVFPFDFGGADVWVVLFRIALVVGIVGSAIAVVVNLVRTVRAIGRRPTT
jgi:hypothetical protein